MSTRALPLPCPTLAAFAERLDNLRTFVSCGLTHWGSDAKGVATTRRFLLELLSYTHRYVPLPLLEVVPQQMHW